MIFLKPLESIMELGHQYNLNIREKLKVLNNDWKKRLKTKQLATVRLLEYSPLG
jgi:hypothetical protein